MRLDELANLMDVPTKDFLESILKQARTQEEFNLDPNLPDEVLENFVDSLEIHGTP
jgi:hypothetical protein